MRRYPIIETERLIIRLIRASDAPAVFEYAKIPGVGEDAGWLTHTSLKQSKRFIQDVLFKRTPHEPGPFVLTLKPSDALIGVIELHTFVAGFKAQLGMVMHPDFQRQGLMYEATLAMLVYGFEHLNLKRISYHHFPDNLASKALREKLPLRYEGLARAHFMMPDGRLKDSHVSAITKQDYETTQAAFFKEVKQRITIDF